MARVLFSSNCFCTFEVTSAFKRCRLLSIVVRLLSIDDVCECIIFGLSTPDHFKGTTSHSQIVNDDIGMKSRTAAFKYKIHVSETLLSKALEWFPIMVNSRTVLTYRLFD